MSVKYFSIQSDFEVPISMLTECHVYMHIVVYNKTGFVDCGAIKAFGFIGIKIINLFSDKDTE